MAGTKLCVACVMLSLAWCSSNGNHSLVGLLEECDVLDSQAFFPPRLSPPFDYATGGLKAFSFQGLSEMRAKFNPPDRDPGEDSAWASRLRAHCAIFSQAV